MYWPNFMEQIRGWHYHQLPLVLAMSTPRGLFHQHPVSSKKINTWNTRPEITSTVRTSSRNPRVCPKHAFGHTYKVPAWNPHKKYDLRTTQTSRGHYEALVKHPLVRGVATPAGWMLPGGMQQHQASLSQTGPPKCCYFVVVGGLACLADPRGYASWSFDSW